MFYIRLIVIIEVLVFIVVNILRNYCNLVGIFVLNSNYYIVISIL